MKNIRKISIIFIAACFIFTFTACGQGANTASPYTPRQIAEIIIAAQDSDVIFYPLLPDDEYYGAYVTDIYNLGQNIPDDGVIFYAGGIEASEIAVLLLSDNDAAENVKNLLSDYKERRAAAFTGYAPEQSALAEQGVAVRHGAYAALLICVNADKAESLFISCFGNEPPNLPGEAELARVIREPESTSPENVNNAAIEQAEASESTKKTAETPSATQGSTASHQTTAMQTAPVSQAAPITQATTAQPAAIEPTASQPSAAGQNTDRAPATEQTSAQSETEPSTTIKATSTETTAEQPPATEPATEPVTEPVTSQPAAGAMTAESDPAGNGGANDPGNSGGESENTQQSADNHSVKYIGPSDPNYVLADDAYDHEAILKAWRGAGRESLTYKNRMIMDICYGVIKDVIRDGMSEYDKELAINDWIVQWADYDRETLSNAPDAKPDPDNENPYGLLVGKRAICRGYTTTFQLFMDMLGIECITVEGTARAGVETHAWNMVRLDGEWYCVDVTWNDPVVSSGNTNIYMFHRFFNVTSQFLRDNDHQWDETNVPEATADKYAWKPISP